MDDLDLVADLNAQDDDGLRWTTLADGPRAGAGAVWRDAAENDGLIWPHFGGVATV